MTEITAQMVKDLRESTSAGMLDCKKALTETNGDMEAAVDWLRKKGLASAAKKASRIAAEGLVAVAVDGQQRRRCRSKLRNRLCRQERHVSGICCRCRSGCFDAQRRSLRHEDFSVPKSSQIL